MTYGDINTKRIHAKTDGGTHSPSAALNFVNSLALILCMAAFSLSLYELFYPNTMASGMGGMSAVAAVMGKVALISSAAILLLSAKSLSAFALSLLLYIVTGNLVGSDAIARVLILFTVSVSLCAFMITMVKKSTLAYILISPLAAFLASSLVCRDPGFSTLTLLPFAVGAVMGVMTRKKCKMTDCLVCSSLVVIFVICVSFGVAMAILGLNLSQLAQAVREWLISAIENSFVPMYMEGFNSVFDAPEASAAIYESLMKIIPSAVISLVNIAPAIIICTVTVAVYMSRSIQISFLSRYGGEKYISPDTVVLQMSLASAVVFVISTVFSVSTDAAGVPDMVSSIATNIMLITMPGLIYTGCFSTIGLLLSLLKKKQLLGVVLFLGLAAIMLFSVFPLIFHILAFVGAVFVIIHSIGSRTADNIGKGDV